MKTVLAIWHSSDKGKTETLRAFANLLISTFPMIIPLDPKYIPIPATGDFRFVGDINGVRIGIESEGDPNSRLQERLLELANDLNCGIILCTSRTRGDTVAAVDNLVPLGFETIWTSTYQISDISNRNRMNLLKARHLLELLQELRLF
jgi:hypothetical protein